MEKKGIIVLLLAIATMASAQDVKMKDVFGSMPDSIFTYLSHNNRLDMIDFRESSMKAEVDNSLGGKSVLDTLTADYLHLTLNETTSVEMKLFESERLLDDTTKTVVCIATTYSGMETLVEFYTSKWHKLDIPLDYDRSTMISRPDTMSVTTYDELSQLVKGFYVVAKLSPSSTNIELTPTFPKINNKDKERLEAIKKQKILNFHSFIIKFLNN